jgi:Ca2+-binding EF-hand superfamily protein
MRRIGFGVLLGTMTLLLAVSPAVSQFPSGGFGKSGGSSKGGGMFGDPSKLFDWMSGGKDVVTRDTLTDTFRQKMFDGLAQKLGVTNGVITREQFNAMMQQNTAGMSGGAPGAAATGPDGPKPSAGGGPSGKLPPGGGFDLGELIDRRAEELFRTADANGDGELNYDEMSENLRTERDKWDANKNGFIDLTEFKAFVRGVMQQRMNQSGGVIPGGPMDPDTPALPEEEPKPVVYRAGKLPANLPPWFKTTDTDGDAQISFFEWRSGGKTIDEFGKLDRNGDGFLTIAEVLYHSGGKNNINGVAVVSSTGTAGTGPSSGSGPSSPSTSGRTSGPPGSGFSPDSKGGGSRFPFNRPGSSSK